MKRLITKFKRLSSKSPVAIDVSGPSSPDIEAMDDPTHDIIEHSSPTWLHDVPPEIRRYLLSLLNLSQLKQLVRASSVFHQQYLFDRKCLLQQSIKETIGSAVIDAHAVLLFTSYYEDHEHEILALFASDPDGQIYHTLVSLLNGYSENSVKRCCSSFEELDQDSLSAISAFYFKAVRPFAEYCTRQAWDQLAEQSQNKESCRNLEWNPSRTELLRFTRAVYRFQLLCLIVKIARPVSHGSIETLILKFLSAFEAWEIEELYCVFLFATDVYDKVFNRIWEDLHPRNPRFDDQGRPPTPHGAFDLEPREWNSDREQYLEGALFLGLPFLNDVLFWKMPHEDLVLMMQKHLERVYISFDTGTGLLGSTEQEIRRRDSPTARDEMQDKRVPMPFVGDGNPDDLPIAWTLIWNGTYSNLYGSYLPEEIRPWGYIFWDEATLDATGGKELLRKQWVDYWDDDYDPRDDIF